MDDEHDAITNNNDSKSCTDPIMTSLDHDDAIEIISSHAESTPATDSLYTELTSVDVSLFDVDVTPKQKAVPEDKMLVLARGPSKKKIAKIPPPTKKQKRIKRAVMVLGTLLILMSLILVAVMLSMSDHIDEMVRKLNGQTTTQSNIPAVKPHNSTG